MTFPSKIHVPTFQLPSTDNFDSLADSGDKGGLVEGGGILKYSPKDTNTQSIKNSKRSGEEELKFEMTADNRYEISVLFVF